MAKSLRSAVLHGLGLLARVLTAAVIGTTVAAVYFGLDYISRAEKEPFTTDRKNGLLTLVWLGALVGAMTGIAWAIWSKAPRNVNKDGSGSERPGDITPVQPSEGVDSQN
jgi:hypothetical protein